jgi:hypothetical protein
MSVRDFVEVPLPILVVQRAEPEGVEIKSTKSGKDPSRSDCRSRLAARASYGC